MPKEISATEAVEAATEFLQSTGLSFFVITSTTTQPGIWYIEVMSLMGKYGIQVDRETGEVLEYEQLAKP